MTGNKEILDKTAAIAEKITVQYQNNDTEKINEVLYEYLTQIKELDKIPKCYNLNQLELTHSIGNSKIGNDTLCISLNTGLLCVMGLTGNCGNCGICYAVAQNKMYFKNTVPKNTINQYLINEILLDNVSLHEVLMQTVYSIYCKYSSTELAKLKFLRFNVEGDILNNDILEIADNIAETICGVFGLVSAYSYTHNKELDLCNAKNINFNCSDFYNASCSSCRTISRVTAELRQQIVDGLLVLCDGDCNNCSYCKDKNNTKTVLFLKHGGKYKGFKQIEETDAELVQIVRNYKKKAYEYFILRETAESF